MVTKTISRSWLLLPVAGTALFAAAIVGVACGGEQTNAGMDDILVPMSAVSEDAYGPKAPTTSSHVTPTSTSGGGAASGLNDEQKDQLRLALKRGGENAARCPTSVP